MLMPVAEAWPGLAGVQKIGLGINWLTKKWNITGKIDNEGQNKNFIDGESKMKLKNWKITLGPWSRDVLRFGFYAITKTLQETEILARGIY